MVRCQKCAQEVDEGPFCGNCGSPLPTAKAAAAPPEAPPPAPLPARAGGGPQINTVEGVVGKLETVVFFRIARGYAWLIALLAIVGLVIALATTAPLVLLLLSPEEGVSADDVRSALGQEKKGGFFGFGGEDASEKIDPKALAKLDEAIYEVIKMLPASSQKEQDLERTRNKIRRWVSCGQDTGDCIDLVRDGRSVLGKFEEAERLQVLEKYFELRVQKSAQSKERKALAVAGLLQNVAIVLGTVIIVTLASMVLVLLAVERNTRRG